MRDAREWPRVNASTNVQADAGWVRTIDMALGAGLLPGLTVFETHKVAL